MQLNKETRDQTVLVDSASATIPPSPEDQLAILSAVAAPWRAGTGGAPRAAASPPWAASRPAAPPPAKKKTEFQTK